MTDSYPRQQGVENRRRSEGPTTNQLRVPPIMALLAALVALLALPGTAAAQSYLQSYGQPAYSTPTPVQFGYVEQANGHLHLEIPLGTSFPQRGSKKGIQFRLVYDSNIWAPVPSGGVTAWTPDNVPVFGDNVGYASGWTLLPWLPASIADNASGDTELLDANQTAHYFPTQTGNAYASDSSGYYLTGTVSYGGDTGQAIYGPDGSIEDYSLWGYTYPIDPLVEGPNGNYLVDCNTTGICDTTGRELLYTNQNGSQVVYSVSNSQGGQSNYTVTLVQVQLKSNFGQSGITECSGQYCTAYVVESIALPDGSSYSFKYDCDSTISGQSAVCSSPGGQSAYYGELTQMTTPQGGQITYTWQTFFDAYNDAGEWLETRTAGGGTWTYTPQVISSCSANQVGCQQSLTVEAPSGRETKTTFRLDNGAWPIETQTWNGILTSTVTTTWDFSHGCVLAGCIGHSYIRKLSETASVLGSGSSWITKKTEWSYDTYEDGLITAVQQWGYYPGSNPTFPSTPDRATDYTWYSPANSPVSTYGGTNIHRPATISIYGNGNLVSQTTTSYDQAAPGPKSGIVNHDDTNYPTTLTVRGNPTEVQRWISGGSYVTTQLSYDETGQMTQAVDGNNNTTHYYYDDNYFNDTNGNDSAPASYTPPASTNAYLTKVVYPSVGGQTFQELFGYYYGSGKMAESSDFNSQVTYYHFIDPFDRPTATLGPKDAQGNYTDWSLTVYASPTETDHYAAVADGSPSASCSSCRHTEITYDPLGREISNQLVNRPGGPSEVDTTYDSEGRVATVSHPYIATQSEVYETYTYDGLDRVTRVTHPDNQFVDTAYGPDASADGAPPEQDSVTAYPTLTTDEAGKQRETWTDGFGRTVEVDEPVTAGTHSTGSFSITGQEMQVPGGGWDSGTITVTVGSYQTQVSYGVGSSSSGLAQAIANDLNSSGLVTATSFSSTVSMTSIATGTGADYSFSISSESDYGLNPPSFQASPSSGAMSGASNGTTLTAIYTYDAAGRLTQVSQGSQTRTYAYDGLGRLTSATIPEASCPTTYTYDGDGNVLTKTAPAPNQTSCSSPVITTYSYDALNRLTGKSYSSGQASVSYSYDAGAFALGRLTGIQDATGSTTYAYDAAGRLTSSSKTLGGQTYTATYTLETDGQATHIVYPSGRDVQESYDAVGELTGVSNGGTNYLTIPGDGSGYDASGNVLSETYGNGVAGAFSYSLNRAQLSSLSYAKSGTTLFGLNYLYQYNSSSCATGTTDDDGLIDCIQDTVQPGRTASYTYDAVGRLITAKTAGSTAYPQWGLSWTYDVYGNRLSQSVTAGTGPSNSVSVSGSTNHITTAGYGYDAAGNMTDDGANTLTYDDESKITAVSGSYGSGSYQYDGSGMRVEKTVSGATTVYIFSGSKVIAEYASGAAPNSPEKEYIYAGGAVAIAEIDSGGTVKYYEADTLSVRQLTDSSGTVLEDQGQFPYGESWYQSSTQTEFQFTNYLHDSESDNEYAYAREYVNRLARFESLDPAAGSVSDPLSWNRYTYTEDDPVNLGDPSGACMSGGSCYGSAPPGMGSSAGSVDRYGCDEFDWATASSFCNEYVAKWTDPDWSPWPWVFKLGMLYGHDYGTQSFSTLAGYFAWRSGLAVEPANMVYSVFAAEAKNKHLDPDKVYKVTVQWTTAGLVPVVTVPGAGPVDRSNLPGYYPDPVRWFHHGHASWYHGLFYNVTHLVATPLNISGHIDPFGPANPLHYIIQLPLGLVTGSAQSAYCSVNGGCTLGSGGGGK